MPESKQQKFERIAERRVTEAIRQLRLIGNLSDKRNYVYTEEHVREIFDAIDAECKAMKGRFRSIGEKDSDKFSFKISKH